MRTLEEINTRLAALQAEIVVTHTKAVLRDQRSSVARKAVAKLATLHAERRTLEWVKGTSLISGNPSVTTQGVSND